MSILKRAGFIQGGILLLLAFFYLLVSWPGLHGPFVLDDWSNLSHLEDVNSWRDMLTYTFGGTASFLGRPVSLLSFALQAEHWVDNTFPFKIVNVLIHLFNSFLLYGISFLLTNFIGIRGNKRIVFATLCSFLWLFLALNISTVFYVVQRMTLLAGTFTLIGILGFLYGVLLDERTGGKSGWLVASFSMGAGYLLGIASKENAIMLGLFVGITYVSLVRPSLQRNLYWWDRWIAVFAILPMLLLFIYLTWDLRFLRGYIRRDFDLVERLLTEWRILWDYFFKIILPSPQRLNIFNDDFSISRSLFDPLTTFLAGFSWLILTILSWKYRKNLPFLFFFVIWFAGGHSLESSIVALELYFEHRNYLPSVGVIIAFVWLMFFAWEKIGSRSNNGKHTLLRQVSVVSLVFYCAFCIRGYQLEVREWKDDEAFHMSGLKDRPESFRANQAAAAYLAGAGDIKRATYLFYALEKMWPGYPGTYAYLIYLQCVSNNVVLPSREELKERFLTGRVEGGQAGRMFTKIHEIKRQGGCPKLSWGDYRYWLSLLMENKNTPKYGSKQNLLKMMVLSYVTEGDIKSAVAVLDPLPFNSLRVSTVRLRMELLMMLNRDEDALSLIQQVKKKFGLNFKVWNSQGHYFLEAEDQLNKKKEKVKRLFDINDGNTPLIVPFNLDDKSKN